MAEGSECVFVGESPEIASALAIVRTLAFILSEKESC